MCFTLRPYNRQVMSALATKQAELKEVMDKLAALDRDLQEKRARKQALEAEVELCKVKLDRAEQLITGALRVGRRRCRHACLQSDWLGCTTVAWLCRADFPVTAALADRAVLHKPRVPTRHQPNAQAWAARRRGGATPRRRWGASSYP